MEKSPEKVGTRRSGESRQLLVWTVGSTVLAERVTIAIRYGTGVNAVTFNKDAPLLLQIHHMFWSLPLFAVAPLFFRRRSVAIALFGCGFGLIASDLIHHFAVLPLIVGNTGWHWP